VQIISTGGGTCSGILAVEFLVLEISLSAGRLAYPSASNGPTQPYGTGFQPTCDGTDTCQLDSSMPCVGTISGQKNCGTCYVSAADFTNQTLQIWNSWYGWDAQGRALLSGQENPLNFRAYAGGSVYQTIGTSLSQLTSGNPVSQNQLGPA
jgi:hypothetical protein